MSTVRLSSRSWWRRARIILENPISSLALGILLIAILNSLPAMSQHGCSTVGDWIQRSVLGKPQVLTFSTEPTVYVVREPDGLRAIDENSQSWDELVALVQARPRDVYKVEYHHPAGESGFFATTRWWRVYRIEVTAMAGKPTPEELAAVRAFGVRKLDRGPEAMPLRDVFESGHLWNGYVLNAVTVFVFVAFVRSFWWIAPARQLIRTARKRSRSRRGLCPHCGYPLAGLSARNCPECGTPFPPNEKPPAYAGGLGETN